MKTRQSKRAPATWRSQCDQECGGERGAITLSNAPRSQAKRRRRCVLPTQSKTWRTLHAFCLLTSVFCLPVVGQFAIDWSKIAGGGGTSTGGVYSVRGTIGQPDAGGPLTNGQYSVIGGFWALPIAVQTVGAPLLSIAPAVPGQATIWWVPATPGFVLEETLSLTFPNWTNSVSAATNPIVVPAALPTKFYRLRKP